MPRRPHRRRPAQLGWAIGAVLSCALAGAAPALGARLVGGHRQAAIARAFTAARAHRGQLIVSIRESTVSPSWSVVRSVRPERGGRTSAGARPLKILSAYYDSAGGAERPGRPPSGVLSDLGGDFKIAVVYTGSGAETVSYDQVYPSACDGAGQYSDQQTDTVGPMSWSVRYVVDLDKLVEAVKDGQGATVLPSVSFDAARSRLNATEQDIRTAVDAGCANTPSTHQCTIQYGLGGPGAAGALSFDSGGGLEVGVPSFIPAAARCHPDDFVLGPSLWNSGATTALVGELGLVGGHLPSNPYTPIAVAWPASSAVAVQGVIAGPCQGNTSVCTDSMTWQGTVALQPATTG